MRPQDPDIVRRVIDSSRSILRKPDDSYKVQWAYEEYLRPHTVQAILNGLPEALRQDVREEHATWWSLEATLIGGEMRARRIDMGGKRTLRQWVRGHWHFESDIRFSTDASLVSGIESRDPLVRVAATSLLGSRPDLARACLPTLKDRLTDADPFTRIWTAWTLSELGGEIRSLESVVRDRLTDAVGEECLALTWALYRSHADFTDADQLELAPLPAGHSATNAVLTSVRRLWSSSDPFDRFDGLLLVRRADQSDRSALFSDALPLTDDPVDWVMLEALDNIPTFDTAHDQSNRGLPLLLSRVTNAGRGAGRAAILLSDFGLTAVPSLTDGLRHPECQEECARALHRIGEIAAPLALPTLLELLARSPSQGLVMAVAQMGEQRRRAIPLLTPLIRAADFSLQEAALGTLVGMRPLPDDVFEDLWSLYMRAIVNAEHDPRERKLARRLDLLLPSLGAQSATRFAPLLEEWSSSASPTLRIRAGRISERMKARQGEQISDT